MEAFASDDVVEVPPSDDQGALSLWLAGEDRDFEWTVGATALILCVKNHENVEFAKFLLDQGADPNRSQDKHGLVTPLSQTLMSMQLDREWYNRDEFDNGVRMLELLVEKGARVGADGKALTRIFRNALERDSYCEGYGYTHNRSFFLHYIETIPDRHRVPWSHLDVAIGQFLRGGRIPRCARHCDDLHFYSTLSGLASQPIPQKTLDIAAYRSFSSRNFKACAALLRDGARLFCRKSDLQQVYRRDTVSNFPLLSPKRVPNNNKTCQLDEGQIAALGVVLDEGQMAAAHDV